MKKSIWMIASLSLLLLNACKQNNNEADITPQDDMKVFANATEAQTYSDEDQEYVYLGELVAQYSQRPAARELRANYCFTVSLDSTNKQMTIDFGSGCVGPYGRERKGKIIVSYNTQIADSVSGRTITFDNYYVNNNQITGEITVSRAARDNDQHWFVTRTMNNYTIHFAGGNNFVINGSNTKTWISGEGDGNWFNNIFSITGDYTGESTTGRKFTLAITDPVIVNFSCLLDGKMARTSGIISLAYEGIKVSRTRTVDYGDGNCDNSYTVTIDSKTYTENQ